LALTLIKEDGTGKVDGNSYADVADGAACFEGHLYAIGSWPGQPSFHAVGDAIFFDVEADSWFWRFGRRGQKRAELMVDVAKGGIVQKKGFINPAKAYEDGVIGRETLAHFHEGTNDIRAHGNSPGAVQETGRHERAVLSESARQHRRKFEAQEVVTICDHLPLFLGGEQERKIAGKALGIALDGLVRALVVMAYNSARSASKMTLVPRTVRIRSCSGADLTSATSGFLPVFRILMRGECLFCFQLGERVYGFTKRI